MKVIQRYSLFAIYNKKLYIKFDPNIFFVYFLIFEIFVLVFGSDGNGQYIQLWHNRTVTEGGMFPEMKIRRWMI